jgi:hypothetical protein
MFERYKCLKGCMLTRLEKLSKKTFSTNKKKIKKDSYKLCLLVYLLIISSLKTDIKSLPRNWTDFIILK